jgi:hypothetical protein
MTEAFILGGVGTPFARYAGSLSHLRLDDLLGYDGHRIERVREPQALLAYEMNGQPLSELHGAPLRLRNEVELGSSKSNGSRRSNSSPALETSEGGKAATKRITSSSDIGCRSEAHKALAED